jgi:cytochrome c-type biogenesis protein CcmF
MLTVGRACLIIALAIALYGIVASTHGGRAGRREWVASGRRAMYAVAAMVTIAFGILEAAFLRARTSRTCWSPTTRRRPPRSSTAPP